MNGASMAAPHVTGAIACLMEILDDRATPPQIRRHLLGTCQPYAEPDPARVGNGYLDLGAAARSASGTTAAPVPGTHSNESTDTDPDERPTATAPAGCG
jgi:hypothetical protein